MLEIGELDNRLLNGNYLRCVDWIEEAVRVMDIKAVSDFITVLWNVWNSRNNSIFRGVEEDAKVIWDRAASLSKDFWIFNLLEDPVLPIKTDNKAWKKPNQETIKINFDAAVYGMSAWYGLVARDADGFVHGGRMGFVNKELHTEWAELQAMEESIYFARSKNWNSVELESDYASLVNRFNCRQEDLTMLGHRLREIQTLTYYFSHFSFNWAPRCCNKVADALCSWAKTNNCKKDFNMDYPLEIHELVLIDAIN